MDEQPIDQDANTHERRFTLATESTARARLDDFRTGVKEFQKEHPEVLGATIYGSMIKGGQAHEKSDIDAFLYIDGENIPKELKTKTSHVIEFSYRDDFLKKLNVSEEEASSYYHHLRSRVLSNDMLNAGILDRIHNEKELVEYKKMFDEKYPQATSDEERKELWDKEPKTKVMDFGISSMFHARIGTGIEKYRRLFLEKVIALDDPVMADKIWADVYMTLQTYEQRKDITKTIDIPQTIQDALRTYHPDLYKTITVQNEQKEINELKADINDSFEK